MYERDGDLLSPNVIDSACIYRGKLSPGGDILDILVLSEAAHYPPESYRWIHYAGDQAAKPLINALSSPDLNLQLGAVTALGKLRASKAVPTLLDFLVQAPHVADDFHWRPVVGTEEEELRTEVAEALSQIGQPALKGLLELLESGDYRARELSVIALSGIDDEQALQALKDALTDESVYVRRAAARGLESKQNPALDQLVIFPHIEFTDESGGSYAIRVADVETLGRLNGSWEAKGTDLIASGPSKSSFFLKDMSRMITEVSCDLVPVHPTPVDHWKAGVYLGTSDVSDQAKKEAPLYIFHADSNGFYEYSPLSRAGRTVQTDLEPRPHLNRAHNLTIRADGPRVEYFYNGQLASTFEDNYGFLHAAGISAWVDNNRPFKVKFRNIRVSWSSLRPFLVYADDFEGDTLSEGWRLWYGPGHKQPQPPSLCQIRDSRLMLSGRKDQFEYETSIPTFDPKDRLGWAYRNFSEIIRKDTLYELRCWVRSSEDATCRFLLWVHDNMHDEGSTYELKYPSEPVTPSMDWEELRLQFYGSDKYGTRIHLVYAAGEGAVFIDRVELWVVGERSTS